jgi:exopolysaccharide biosynthesis polyprenyl glycosylphosphotransferase
VVVAGDALAAVLAYLTAFAVRVIVPLPFTQGFLPAMRFAEVEHHWLALVGLQLASLYALGLYETRLLTEPRRALQGIVVVATVHALGMVAIYFFRDQAFPRTILVLMAASNATLLVVWRLACTTLMWSSPRRRVLVVGAAAAADELIRTMARQRWLGLDAIGIVTPDGEAGARAGGVPVVGRRADLAALCERHGADEVILVSDDTWQDRVIDAFSHWQGRRARLLVVPSPYEILIGRTEHLHLHDLPMLRVLGDLPGSSERATKRVFDVVLALALLVAAAPVMVLVGLLVRVSSAGPVVFRQERIGRNREPFTILKFRTMHERAEDGTGPVLATENDPRATRIGRILRATRLDELPQLWNVLRGDMSFVGPRPERPEFVVRFEVEIRAYAERFRIRPGLTGYAQVNGEYHSAPATKLKYDLAYMYNRTLWLDLKILADTVRVMLTQRGV